MDSDETNPPGARTERPQDTGTPVGTASEPNPEQQRRTYQVHVTTSPRERDPVDKLTRNWHAQVGTAIPIPPSIPLGESDYRIRILHSKVGDAVVEDLYSESIVGGTGGRFNHLNNKVVIHVGRRGTWQFTRSNGRGSTVNMSGGQFVARLNDPSWDFGIGPRTRSTVLILPTDELGPILADRPAVGSVDSVEVRVLMAHVSIVRETLDDLSPSGVLAARNALVELAKGAVTGVRLYTDEPQFEGTLAEAARDVAERLLTEAELSPQVLARELNVSVRTLQRAFAGTGKSITSYIRQRRLERARQELLNSVAGLTISELAARYHFSDSSHFIRVFKKEYGHPPARWARLDEDNNLLRSRRGEAKGQQVSSRDLDD